MLFEGAGLIEMIGKTANAIELHNQHGRVCRSLSKAEALDLDLDLFIGVGNRRRLRFLRPRTYQFGLNNGSKTTKRITGMGLVKIAHPLIREHRRTAE